MRLAQFNKFFMGGHNSYLVRSKNVEMDASRGGTIVTDV